MSFANNVKRPVIHGFILALILVVLAPFSALALDLMMGWTHSDVGLDAEEDGLYFSAAHYLPMGESDSFDMGLELVYVQRAGSQPAFFYSEILGAYVDEGKVKLHILQPGVTLGYSLAMGNLSCRMYAGGAMGLKMNESWNLAEGDWLDPYGYGDFDFLAIVGLKAKVGRMVLDARYSAGLTEQLILRNEFGSPTDKAGEDLLPGVKDPENGAKLSTFQVGAGWSF